MTTQRYLDRRSFVALLRAARERERRVTARRDHFLIYLLGRTGLRCSEALALRVKDLHLDTDPPYLDVLTLKRRKPVHDQVVIEQRTVRQARRYVNAVLPKLLHRVARYGADPLFPIPIRRCCEAGPVTKAMGSRNARRIFDVYRRRAKLPAWVTLHSLRHYRGSELLRASKDLRWVQQQLRHRFISSTQRYLHVDPELQRRYLAKLDRR